MVDLPTITCQEVIEFAENYAYLSGQNLKKMASFEPVEGNPVCERLRTHLNQLSEDQSQVDFELKTIKANQERAAILLKELGFN